MPQNDAARSLSAPAVWAVVLTYNGLEDTRKCLRSLEPIEDLHTLVVDNGSEDGTADAVRAEFPWCELLRLESNIGPSAGNNRGITHALAAGAEWVLLLNNDTTVRPQLVARLLEAAAAHPWFGIIGAIVNYMDEPEIVMVDGCTFNDVNCAGFFQRMPVPLQTTTPPSVTEVEIVNGCCMMVAATVFRRIGMFDEQFFIYHDETDFCLRARAGGFLCGVIGEQLVWHKGTSSFNRTGKRLPRYYDARNLALLLLKHHTGGPGKRGFLASYIMYLKYVYYLYCVEREEGHPDVADAMIEGLCDGLAGRFGHLKMHRRPALPVVRTFIELGRRRPRWHALGN